MFDADSATDLTDYDISDLYVEPSDYAAFVETLETEGQATRDEIELQTVDGERFWGSVTAITTESSDGTRIDGVVLDISERKEFEERLREQRDSLEILNQMVRHDIRNDLQMVLTYVELLGDRVGPDTQSHVRKIHDSAENAVELTKTARDVADVMLQDEPDLHPVVLQPVLDQQLDELQSAAPDVTVRVEGTIPAVRVRANGMLSSVFRNLLKNAVQHNDTESPKVVVSATDDGDTVTVRIADNGPGIPDGQKADIFGRGEKGLESEGTGIGLYLVDTLVDSYGGDVRVGDAAADGGANRRQVSADGRGHDHLQTESCDLGGAVFVVELPSAA